MNTVFESVREEARAMLTDPGLADLSYTHRVLLETLIADALHRRALRGAGARHVPTAALARETLRAPDGATLDIEARVYVGPDQRAVEVSRHEARVLAVLMRMAPEVVERRDLLRMVWGPHIGLGSNVDKVMVRALAGKGVPVAHDGIRAWYGGGA